MIWLTRDFMQLVNILCVSQFIAVSLVHPVQQVKRVYNLCVSPLMAVCTQKVCCLVTSKVRSSCMELRTKTCCLLP